MEKNIIFYFSGTGNSLKAAKAIAENLDNCEIVSMKKAYTLDGPYARIGFVFPCYGMGLPSIVEKFIKSLNITKYNSDFVFGLVTAGKPNGNANFQLAKLLKEKEVEIKYTKEVAMFANYLILYDLKKDVQLYTDKANKDLKVIAKEIFEKKNIVEYRKRKSLSTLHSLFMSSVPKKAKGYTVSDKCIKCSRCVKICPVGNIKMENGEIKFLHQCEQCVACIQWCPSQAINYKKKTQNRGRYHHPEINCDELF